MADSLAVTAITMFVWTVLNFDFGDKDFVTLAKFLTIILTSLYLLPPFMQAVQPDEEAAKKRKDDLKKACQDPMAKELGLTPEWYDNADEVCANIQSAHYKLAGAVLIYLFISAFPLSVMEHLQQRLEAAWTFLLTTYSRRDLYVFGSWLVFFTIYWVHGLAWTLLDFLRPASLMPFKNQPEYVLTWADFCKISKVVLVNCFVGLLGIWAQWLVSGFTDMDKVFSPTLPTFYDIMLLYMWSIFFTEVTFYYSHKWLHAGGWEYHKLHHEFKAPVAITSIYCHPVELVIGNLPVIITPPFLMNSHLLIFWMFIINVILTSQHGHCGWSLPFLTPTMNHEYHHWEGYDNLGACGLFDEYFHTNTNWKKSWMFKINKQYSHPEFPVQKVLAQQETLEEEWCKVEKEE